VGLLIAPIDSIDREGHVEVVVNDTVGLNRSGEHTIPCCMGNEPSRIG
jgi:hypothetical protein